MALNAAQHQAVIADGNLLVCACPGSGKTHTLKHKVARVLRTVPNSKIIMTTFSREAAQAMHQRVGEMLKKTGQGRLMARLTIGTFHALAMRQLRDAGMLTRILGSIEVKHVIRRALAVARVKMAQDEAEAVIYACKADREYADSHPIAAKLTAVYQKELQQRKACDFADLLLQANKLMRQGKLKPIEATHVFADEFQDIDVVQFEWLMHNLGSGRVAVAVGDDDQSIYGFRASLGYRGMMEFRKRTKAQVVTLDVNYRSTAGILDSAGALIRHNRDRVVKKMTAGRGPGPAPRVIPVAEGEPQLMEIVCALDAICGRNPAPSTGYPLKYRFFVNPGQVAVLARTNRQLDDVEKLFVALNIPYLRSGSSLWERNVAQVFLSLLAGLHNRESTGIEVALRWAGVPDRLLRTLASPRDGDWIALLAGKEVPSNAHAAALADFLHDGHYWVTSLAAGSSNATVTTVIDGVKGWMTNVLTGKCGGAHLEEVNRVDDKREKQIKREIAVIDVIHGILSRLSGSIAARVARARMEGEKHAARVVLSTFHASKGLEWQHVFLMDVEDGIVPKIGDDALPDDIAEERRVFYVAMTRAQDSLVLLTREKLDKMSPFLVEAGLLPPLPKKQAEATCH